MKRNIVLTAIAVALLGSAPSWAAAPFGSFGGKVGGGNSGAGLMPLHGWALDDDGIASVDVLVDGLVAGRADYGRSRPGVTAQYPAYPDSALPGFSYELDTTRYLNGNHTVSIRVKSKSGELKTLNNRVFQFVNVTQNLAPFGKVEFPSNQAEMRGVCDLADPNRRYSVVSGYALDAGVQPDDTGVAYVELMIDRAVFSNTRLDCRYSPIEGGLSDCYGIRRTDIEQTYPTLKDSPHSGFRFVLDVGALITFYGLAPAHHLITIRAADHFGQVTNIAEMPVTFTCDEDTDNENSIGEVGIPRAGLLYGGVIQTQGWALDWEGVSAVLILVDGTYVGEATRGLTRPGVSALYPGYPESAAPGWQYALDTRKLSNGTHELDVIVRDDLGVETYIGKRQFTVGNPTP
ncbi:MAG TPA: hypothetical protein VHU81_11660 [Thermoanaerobaculia bacterium]|jgi:N-acetylmuramoyl-L-alanine amidase|nr:hypothetical protein [Thermoanaerobaculia bacterium]